MLRPSLAWIAALMLPGCVFFDTTYEPCLDTPDGLDCLPAAAGSGGGTDTRTPMGGDTGSGGDATGGSGGSSGGTGGDTSGGGGTTSGGGTGGTSTLDANPRVNEIRLGSTSFVELYNDGEGTLYSGSVTMTSGTSTPDTDNECALNVDVPAGGFHVFAVDLDCSIAVSPCQTCSFALAAGTTAFVLDSADTVLHQATYPASGANPSPSLSQSWAASPDGADSFVPKYPTPGSAN